MIIAFLRCKGTTCSLLEATCRGQLATLLPSQVEHFIRKDLSFLDSILQRPLAVPLVMLLRILRGSDWALTVEEVFGTTERISSLKNVDRLADGSGGQALRTYPLHTVETKTKSLGAILLTARCRVANLDVRALLV